MFLDAPLINKNFIMLKKTIWIPLIILLSGSQLFAQLTINGESRTRGFANYGFQQLPAKGDMIGSYVEQRTRLNFSYKKDSLAEFYFSLQDARVWGESQNSRDILTGIYEAWVKFYLSKSKNSSLTIGRQNVGYDNGRVVSDGDWNNWGNAFDLLLFAYELPEYHFSLNWGSGLNNLSENYFQNESNYNVDYYKYLSYIWLNKKFNENKTSISLMFLMNASQKADTKQVFASGDSTISHPKTIYSFATIGTFYSVNLFKNWFLEGDLYYQIGKDRYGKQIDAWFASAFLSKKIHENLNFGIGYQASSGTDWSDPKHSSTHTNTFNYNIFGMEGSTFFGELNYFSSPENSMDAGLRDIAGGIQYYTSQKTSITADFHIISLDKPYLPNGKKIDSYLGTEIDLHFDWNIHEDLDFGLLYGIMFASNSLKKLQPTTSAPYKNTGQFFRVQIEYTPQIYK